MFDAFPCSLIQFLQVESWRMQYLILSEAEECVLRPVAREVGAQFHIARAASFDRPVSSVSFDVGLYCGFPGIESYSAYMRHSHHLAWCRFMLRGWKLVGSTCQDTQTEFVGYILGSQAGMTARDRERDDTPNCEVVWDGEQVLDFGELAAAATSSAK